MLVRRVRLKRPGLLDDTLTAGDNADELDAIAFRNFALVPFAPMKRDAVVLDENAVWLQSVALGQLGNVLRTPRISALAVQPNHHDARRL